MATVDSPIVNACSISVALETTPGSNRGLPSSIVFSLTPLYGAGLGSLLRRNEELAQRIDGIQQRVRDVVGNPVPMGLTIAAHERVIHSVRRSMQGSLTSLREPFSSLDLRHFRSNSLR
jgi:hypothetical protein